MPGFIDDLRILVRQCLACDGRDRFVRSLGYRNISKGLRRIDAFLCGGEPAQDRLDRLAHILGLDPADVVCKAPTLSLAHMGCLKPGGIL